MKDMLQTELDTLKYTSISNVYPAGFIKHPSRPPRLSRDATVPKMEIAIQLTFRGDNVMQHIYKKLISVSQNFYAAYTSHEIQN